jgi:hypothetical protein
VGFKGKKSCEACASGNNHWLPFHDWHGGSWLEGEMRGFDWKAREYGSLNNWGPTLDQQDLNDFVDAAVSAR